MKRITITLAALLITATTAMAQMHHGGPPPMGAGFGPGGPHGMGGPGGYSGLADYLQLTADQKTAWDNAQTDFANAVQPLHDKEMSLHQQLDTLFTNKSTDANAIGTLMLSIRATGDQIKAAHDAFEQKQQSVLTADQKAKYAAFEAAVEFVHQHEGPRPGGPGPAGFRPGSRQ